MVNSTFDSLSAELNDGLHKLYKDEYGKVFEKTKDIALNFKKHHCCTDSNDRASDEYSR